MPDYDEELFKDGPIHYGEYQERKREKEKEARRQRSAARSPKAAEAAAPTQPSAPAPVAPTAPRVDDEPQTGPTVVEAAPAVPPVAPVVPPSVQSERYSVRSLLTTVGPSGVEGIPGEYNDGTEWLRNGLRRHLGVSIVSVIVGWTGVWISLWGAAIGAIVGLFVALGVVSVVGAPLFSQIGGGQAVTIVSVMAGLVLGAVGGFLEVLKFIVWHPIALVGSAVAGAILSLALVIGAACFERWGLRVRGYRRLSRDEVRKIAPLVRDAADAMNIPALPRFAIQDTVIPNAWTHMRTVVVTTGMLETLTDGEIRAILAHEFAHWRAGDSVGLRFIWAAAWPVTLIYNLGVLLSGRAPGAAGQKSGKNVFTTLLAVIGWFILWPSWVITKCLIAPLTAASQRRYEYEADARAFDAGYGPDLISALRKISAFEGGRTGWEAAMAATHPPTELRIEALQPSHDDDWEYQEDELRGPSKAEIRRILSFHRSPKVPQSAQTLAESESDA